MHRIGEIISYLRQSNARSASALRKKMLGTDNRIITMGGQHCQIEYRRLRVIQRCERLLNALAEPTISDRSIDLVADSLFAAKIIYGQRYQDLDGGAWNEFGRLESELLTVFGVKRTIRVPDVKEGLIQRKALGSQIMAQTSWLRADIEAIWDVLLQLDDDPVAFACKAVLGTDAIGTSPIQAWIEVLVRDEISADDLPRILAAALSLRDGRQLVSKDTMLERIRNTTINTQLIEYFILQPDATHSATGRQYIGIGIDSGLPASIRMRKMEVDGIEIDLLLRQLRLSWGANSVSADTRKVLSKLGKDLLCDLLTERVKTISITPVAGLWGFPFEGLIHNDDFLGLKYGIVYTRTSRLQCALSRPIQQQQNASNALIVSACDYDLDKGFEARGGIPEVCHLFESLPMSREEGAAVFDLLGGTHLEGGSAMKDLVLAAVSPLVMHFATHAFYYEQKKNTERTQDDLFQDDRMPGYLEAGIVLTGANAFINDNGEATFYLDGILTAMDILRMDLTSTAMVGLSCCDSGRSEIDSVSGPNGFIGAFLDVGVQAVLSAMWPVDDHAACTFFKLVYAELINGSSLAESVLSTRRRMQKKDEAMDHFAFAIFGVDIQLESDNGYCY